MMPLWRRVTIWREDTREDVANDGGDCESGTWAGDGEDEVEDSGAGEAESIDHERSTEAIGDGSSGNWIGNTTCGDGVNADVVTWNGNTFSSKIASAVM